MLALSPGAPLEPPEFMISIVAFSSLREEEVVYFGLSPFMCGVSKFGTSFFYLSLEI